MKLSDILSQLADLRYELVTAAKSRQKRFRIRDRSANKVIAAFENEHHAITALGDIRRNMIKELEHELAKESISVPSNG